MSETFNVWGDDFQPSQADLERREIAKLDYERRHSWKDCDRECMRARTCNGYGYRIPLSTFISYDESAEWYKATCVPCGCTCNSDHIETNRYWVETLRKQPPEPSTFCQRELVLEEEAEDVDWAAYYHQAQRKKEECQEKHGKLLVRLPAAQIAASSGSAVSVQRLQKLQGEINRVQQQICSHQYSETLGRQNYNEEQGSADWGHRVAAGQGERKTFKGSKPKGEGRIRAQT